MMNYILSIGSAMQETGFWAYDCIHKEMALVCIIVLAELGDNPMTSEMAGHLGLTAKYFCRICWVKGLDLANNQPVHPPDLTYENADTQSDNNSGNTDSDSGYRPATGLRGRSKQETMQQLVERAKRFVNVSQNCGLIIDVNLST